MDDLFEEQERAPKLTKESQVEMKMNVGTQHKSTTEKRKRRSSSNSYSSNRRSAAKYEKQARGLYRNAMKERTRADEATKDQEWQKAIDFYHNSVKLLRKTLDTLSKASQFQIIQPELSADSQSIEISSESQGKIDVSTVRQDLSIALCNCAACLSKISKEVSVRWIFIVRI